MKFRPMVFSLEGRDLCSGLFAQVLAPPTSPVSAPTQVAPADESLNPADGLGGTPMLDPTSPLSSPSGSTSTNVAPVGDFNPVGGSSMLV